MASAPSAHAGRHYTVSSTAYASCDGSSTLMANGRHTHWGVVANNFLRLGTMIHMDHAVHGRHWFRVEDRIGSGSQLDFWMPHCSWMNRWGRRRVGFTVHRHG